MQPDEEANNHFHRDVRLADIQEAFTTIRSTGSQNIALLHCVSLYPTVPRQVNLKMMDTIRNAFHLPTWFSDHSLGINIAIAAIARGANILEKHFTVDRTLTGPDHAFALDKYELSALVKAIWEVEESLGSPIKRSDIRRIGKKRFESTQYHRCGRYSIFYQKSHWRC